MKIKPVLENEGILRIVTMAAEIWPEHYAPIVGEAQVEYMLGKFQTKDVVAQQIREGYLYYRVLEGAHEVGYFAVRPEPFCSKLFLSKIYLFSSERGKGYGRLMMDFVEGLARKRGLLTVRLRVHKRNPSLGLYRHMGFKVIESLVQDIGNGFVLDDYRMEKIL